MPELDSMRDELASIDNEIVKLVGRRNKIAEQIGIKKAESGASVVVPSVEKVVVSRYVEAGKKEGVSAHTSTRLARAVIDESVDIQGRVPRHQPPKSVFIIGGNGGMGRWLSDFFSKRGHCVTISDINLNGAKYPAVSVDEGCKSDVIVIAVTVTSASEVLSEVLSKSKDSLIFDILSVKEPVIELLKSAAKEGRNVCSVHPMFGPSAPSAAGRNIIISDCGSEFAVEKASELFSVANLSFVPVENHDSLAAYVLGLSHAVNLAFTDALVSSGFTSDELRYAASTTFNKQTAVSREVSEENAELYYAIQRENPENSHALENLELAVSRVRTLSHDEFVNAMKKGADWYISENI